MIERVPKPEWLKVKVPGGPNFSMLKQLARGLKLNTVCESARCPNIGECWEAGTATFMILGNTCTRRCGFCAVPSGKPLEYDTQEPERVAEAVQALRLNYVVITSVARDDLPDGGAWAFAQTIRAIRARQPQCRVEVLIPDFRGSIQSLKTVMDAEPFVLNHNIETVERLQKPVRKTGRYEWSLNVLANAKRLNPAIPTKSGLMLGLGETWDEILQTMRDLRAVDCNFLTIGQYLRPTLEHLPVARYVAPSEFEELRQIGQSLGFTHVEAGPLVRSSYHAEKQNRGDVSPSLSSASIAIEANGSERPIQR
ncbi:MAG: lipoyl synthase [Acidobacteriota bacterium]|nr:lipoyl synthase [Blastocatellia bacterium]MDW8238012.1 lipoyl synthase [Acidobacteriota bacterium]